jgi:hypothetical protein
LLLLCLAYTGSARAQAPDKAIIPFEIKIDAVQDAPLGAYVSLSITKTAGSEDMHGFDMLIGYDASALTFIEAAGGEIFENPGTYEWEHFEYRSDITVGCDSAWCPSGLIRTVGVADINNGPHQPLDLSLDDGVEMFSIVFWVTDDLAFDCIWIPIRFFWIDCGDNGIAIDMPPTIGLAISDGVYDWNEYAPDISDPDFGFPGIYGAPDSCLIDSSATIRFINLRNGGVNIICSDSIDNRGDINVNGIPNEIADWVMFVTYFIYGLQAFGQHIEVSIAASDINADGFGLRAEDLVYLQRVICGDVPPFPSQQGGEAVHDSVVLIQDLSTRTVSVEYDDTLAAVFLVFKGDITPEFLINTEEVSCNHWYNGEYTCVLIQPVLEPWGECGGGFASGPLFTYSGFGLMVFNDESDNLRTTSAADFENHTFFFNRFEFIGGHDGQASIQPHPLPRSLARISESETVTLHVGGFSEHGIEDVDMASLLVNDTIVPLSAAIISDQAMEIIVSARSFINSYNFGPDTTGHPLGAYLDTLRIRSFDFSVSGQFNDASAFVTLGEVTMFDEPVTIQVPSGWATIKNAVNEAIDDDTVLVAGGTYHEHGILINSNICLRSETGLADCVTIDADSLDRIMTIESVGRGASITGFTFFEGHMSGYPPDGYGGGIYCYGASPTISNCTFSRNIATAGGGMCCTNGSIPILNGCVFSENEATDGAGGMLCMGGSRPTLDDCIFTGNSASNIGGGMVAFMSSTPVLNGCLFIGNSAGSDGGGMFYDGLWNNFRLTLTNCTFSGNSCPGDGSALTFLVSSPALDNCLIAFNEQSRAVYCDVEGYPTFTCCDIYGNYGGDWVDCFADQLGINGNFSLDPLFCDMASGDFHLDGYSPCVRYNNDCDATIGALSAGCGFICGDVSGNYTIDIGDAVYIIAYLFRDGPEPPIMAAADLNANGEPDIADVTLIINFIFRGMALPDCMSD